MRSPERIERIRIALRKNQWDLVVCALPKNVILLSGYWPVVGTGVAIASADGRIALLVPEDEEDLAKSGWADEVRIFKPGSLDEIITAAQAIRRPLEELIASFSAGPLRIGFEASETSEPASYAAMHLFGGTMQSLLHAAHSSSTLEPADEALADLRSRKTESEIKQLRTACEIAGKAFGYGSAQIKIGESEVETADAIPSAAQYESRRIRATQALRRLRVVYVRSELRARVGSLRPFSSKTDRSWRFNPGSHEFSRGWLLD